MGCLLFGPAFLVGCSSARKSLDPGAFAREYSAFRYCLVEPVEQSSQRSCGAAALVAVMNYWKDESQPPFEEPAIQEEFPAASEEGYPLFQLRDIAALKGFAAFAVKLDENPWRQLTEHVEQGRPVIAAIQCPRGRYFGDKVPLVETLDRRTLLTTGNEWKSHYVVVIGRSLREVLCMDPKYGIVRIDSEDFLRFWSLEGYAALICSSL